jgi:GTP-binding protein
MIAVELSTNRMSRRPVVGGGCCRMVGDLAGFRKLVVCGREIICDSQGSVSIMDISSAIFECSAPDLDSCPDEALPEFAFIGRSNVGKSSLLNVLAGQDGLARVSPTPGFTKLINMFTMNKTWRLVDLPGYGFAAGSRKDTTKFNKAVIHYLKRRPNLRCVFALIESALPPQDIDLEFIEWLTRNAVPYVIVFTKMDKVTPTVAQENMAAFLERIAPWFEKLPVTFTCSATTGNGRAELLNVIGELLAAAPPEPDPETPVEPKELPFRTVNQLARANRKRRPDLNRPW